MIDHVEVLAQLRYERSRSGSCPEWGELCREGQWPYLDEARAFIEDYTRIAMLKPDEDAERYRTFRQLVKTDLLAAQAMVWNTSGVRKRLDAAIDAARKKAT